MVRHKSGRYYARLYINGKEIWKSLKTSHFSVAEARLATALKEHRERKSSAVDPDDAKMTFGQAATLHLQRLEEKVSIKKGTKKYWREVHAALLKSWPALTGIEVRKMTTASCREWAASQAKTTSSTRYNNTIAFLRHVLDVAIESGVIYSNSASSLERKTVKPKTLELPSLSQFEAFVAEIRTAGGRDSRNCADLVEGLAYTGCRIGESKHIAWHDLNFTHDEVTVKGDPEEGTKNSQIRRVPMIPSARNLFERMRQERASELANANVFLVHECQKAMDRAAKQISMTRITHHDLRHFFATVCIESGVDIPTVSRWLGHKDGGALAMKTYGHLRREHSTAQAQKVSFAPAVAA